MTEIKKTGTESISVITALAEDIWPDAYKDIISKDQIDYMLALFYSRNALADQIETLQHQFIIAFENGHPVGFASYSPKNKSDDPVYRLHKLYVNVHLHGKGIGKKLLQYIKNDIKPLGATHLELNVNKQNPAQYFYSKTGFIITREECLDIGNGFFMDDYIMTLSL